MGNLKAAYATVQFAIDAGFQNVIFEGNIILELSTCLSWAQIH